MEVIRATPVQVNSGYQNHTKDNASFERFVAYIARLHQARSWFCGGIAGASLAHKVVRTLLWDLLAEDTLLFQAAIFVSGTFSNTCGIPKAQLVHMAPALAVMRGSSMRALREAALTTEQTSYKTAAVALLAGWEKRFGDTESADVHMQVWRSLPLPEHALDEDYVLALLEVTFQVFQDSLIEYSAVEDDNRSPFLAPPVREGIQYLPPGFDGMFHDWTESRSLRAIVCKVAAFNPEARDAVAQIRQLCIEALAWCPAHSQSLTPVPAYEEAIDPVELKLLYHIRATCVSISAMYLRVASTIHQIQWIADVEGAVAAHTQSCHHLETDVLIRNGYLKVALWSRWIICVASRDPESDDLLRHLISLARVHNYGELETLLKRHILPGFLVERSRDLYTTLFEGS